MMKLLESYLGAHVATTEILIGHDLADVVVLASVRIGCASPNYYFLAIQIVFAKESNPSELPHLFSSTVAGHLTRHPLVDLALQ